MLIKKTINTLVKFFMFRPVQFSALLLLTIILLMPTAKAADDSPRPPSLKKVRYQKAPFEHPQLFIPNGHKLKSGEHGNAKDEFIEIKTVGRNGGQPIRRFMQ